MYAFKVPKRLVTQQGKRRLHEAFSFLGFLPGEQKGALGIPGKPKKKETKENLGILKDPYYRGSKNGMCTPRDVGFVFLEHARKQL